MDSHHLIAVSFSVAALGLLLLALPLLLQWRQRRRAAVLLDAALARRPRGEAGAQSGADSGTPATGAAPAGATVANAVPSGVASGNAAEAMRRAEPAHGGAGATAASHVPGWLASPLGRAAVGAEEARLLEQCGYYGPRARATFGAARLLAPLALALAMGVRALPSVPGALMTGFGAFAMLFLGFKLALRHRAARRLRQVDEELPLLVDMLRLLQGVGMSIDQSLQLIVTEFGRMLPVLGPEIRRANGQFASGRSREQTLQRIGRLFDSDDLRSLIQLLTQVDRFGGAVQEPLRAFGLRLQEARKLRLKEKVGRLTVKMTGVMVVSLLPVLLIVTAGPGFLGVIRMLGQFTGDIQ